MDNIAAPCVIEWFGPFGDMADARQAARDNIAAVDQPEIGIYLAIGHPANGWRSRLLWRFTRPRIAYVGIGLHANELDETRDKLSRIRKCRAWIGWLRSYPTPNHIWVERKHDPKLDDAEWAFVYFLKPPLNDKKKASPPRRPILLQSRWFSGRAPYTPITSPFATWPDVFVWPVVPSTAKPCTRSAPLDFGGLRHAALVWLAPRREVQIIEM